MLCYYGTDNTTTTSTCACVDWMDIGPRCRAENANPPTFDALTPSCPTTQRPPSGCSSDPSIVMANTLPSHNPLSIPVVAVVVDSSITLASEWHHIIHAYFPNLFGRLAGGVSIAVNYSYIAKLFSPPLILPCYYLAPPPRIRHLWTSGLRRFACIRQSILPSRRAQ